MRYLFVLLFFALGCNQAAKPPLVTEDSARPDGTEVNDTAPLVIPDTSATVSPTKLPGGFYRTQLPCEGCKGIEHTVYFKPNKTFTIEETRLDKTPVTTTTSGTFNPSGGLVWAYRGQVVKARYTWQADTLYYLQPNGKRLAMQPLTAATDNDVWRRKGKEGLAFYGTGTEPFWNLEIGKGQTLAFHQAEWTKPLRFSAYTLRRSGDSIVYTATSDTASLTATIYNRFCSDGMSDYIYTHSLQVRYKGQTFKGCGILY